MRLILILACLLIAIPAHSEGWQLDIRMRDLDEFQEWSQRLTKSFGNTNLSVMGRQLGGEKAAELKKTIVEA